MTRRFPDLSDFQSAHDRIAPYLTPTPLIPANHRLPAQQSLWLKLEAMQPTGAFKIRGALNSIVQLSESARSRGVVCASTGNHARALSYAARMLDVPATVCMSKLVPEQKIAAVRALGARVEIVGESQDEAQKRVDQIVINEGAIEIPPFDAFETLVGQGTLILEVHKQRALPKTIIVPVSGGGLVAGVAACAKLIDPEVRVIGVSMRRGAAMAASLDAGSPVEVEELPTLADSLGGGIGLNNQYTYAITQHYLDDLILLSEEAIAEGMRQLFYREQLVLEGGGAVPYALTLERPDLINDDALLILSGRNVDPEQFLAVLNHQLPFGGDL